jgi:hypothetical protein
MNVLDKHAIETVILDETVLDDHLGCEFKHRRSTCSVEVTHVVSSSCRGIAFTCTTGAKLKQKQIDAGKTFCHCGKFAGECWRVAGPI